MDITVALSAMLFVALLVSERLGRRRRHMQAVTEHWRPRLEALGIEVACRHRRLEARALLDGIDVRIRYLQPLKPPPNLRQFQGRCVLEIEQVLPVQMPRGQRVVSLGLLEGVVTAMGGQDVRLGHPYLDNRIRVVTEDIIATRTLLTWGRVPGVLDRCARNVDLTLDLEGARLVAVQRSEDSISVEAVVRMVLELGSALTEAAEAPWRGRAEALGLTVQGGVETGARQLAGVVDGVEVTVTVAVDPDTEAPLTRVLARLEPPLPAGLRIKGRSPGAKAGGVGAGNPVLDSVIDVFATDVERARRLLSDDAVTGPLLEVLHAHPRSQVHPRGVVLVEPDIADEGLGRLVRAVVDLATALTDAASRAATDADSLASGG